MTNLIQSDKKRRNLFRKFEYKRRLYKSLLSTMTLSTEFRMNIFNILHSLPRNSTKARIKNRCLLTGRGKSVYRFCKLSRLQLRSLASQGLLLGVVKCSW